MSEPLPASRGTLYLVPVALGGDPLSVLPAPTLETVRRLDTFIVENAKSARQFLKSIAHPAPLQRLHLHTLDEHSSEREAGAALALLLSGSTCGLLSEAGCPAVADPGAGLVRRAHAAGIRVVPLVGPSSLLLALMASGLDGQHFSFHGYLPVDRARRFRAIRDLEARAALATQVFIETPYRAASLFSSLLEACRADTLLCVAADLTLPGEFIATRAVGVWKRDPPVLERRLVVFLMWRPARGITSE